jgi:Leucine-rich repeat (LRR) protein
MLDLDSNNLFGEIPHELQNLRNLQTLNLGGNNLSRALMSGLFNNTPDLSVIHLGSNRLTGGVPASIASLSKLETLVLEDNLLSGPMTPAIFNMSQLQAIYVVRNNLSGTIPGNESFHLPMLQLISLGENQFEGPRPCLDCEKISNR